MQILQVIPVVGNIFSFDVGTQLRIFVHFKRVRVDDHVSAKDARASFLFHIKTARRNDSYYRRVFVAGEIENAILPIFDVHMRIAILHLQRGRMWCKIIFEPDHGKDRVGWNFCHIKELEGIRFSDGFEDLSANLMLIFEHCCIRLFGSAVDAYYVDEGVCETFESK